MALSQWLSFINTGKAVEMIIAIFISVILSFLAGWLMQFIIRALVSFKYKKYMKWGGSLFGSLSVLIVLNFIIRVGLKNSPLRNSGAVLWVTDHLIVLFAVVFVLAFVSFFILSGGKKKVDIFRVITLLGTFALAMAFASNDLVNFIGVPVAGYEAFQFWKESGQPATEYTLEVFNGPAGASTSNPLFLYIAGIIMIVTLWTSKRPEM